MSDVQPSRHELHLHIDLPCLTETSVTLHVTGESTNLEKAFCIFFQIMWAETPQP